MSRGKYSPTITRKLAQRDYEEFRFNAWGELPPTTCDGTGYCEEIHFANYDEEGFDSYGYSAYNSEKNYVGIGNGVDRNGVTENEYLAMSDEEFEEYL